MTGNHSADRLALPPPDSQASETAVPTTHLEVEGSSIKLDDLGPMVVNSDGVSVDHPVSFSSIVSIGLSSALEY